MIAEGVLWALHLALLWFQPARSSRRRVGTVVVGVASFGTALGYGLATGDTITSLFALSLAISGTWAWATNEATNGELERLERERDELAARIAEAALREERLRIARELHDGIGASLTAILWRSLRLDREIGGDARLLALSTRARSALDELRAAMWALHASRRSWAEVVHYVRERAAECEGPVDVVNLSPDEGHRVFDTDAALAFVRAAEAHLRVRRPGEPLELEIKSIPAESRSPSPPPSS
ncbi:MAG: hypothetical protein KF819_03995 [Labilithrix sp.]|nr:hypothetical protein [Labilithrix sp.]